MLKGEVGTILKIKVSRDETKEPLVFEIERKKIQIDPVVYYGIVGENTGYVYVSTFNDKTSSEIKNAFQELKKKNNISSFILDLRNNTGGLLEEAVQTAGFFLPRGTQVLSTKGKIKQNNRTYRTPQAPLDTNIPLAVLVNGATASASEIVSGAFQDLDRAVIVGSRTYGKGLVQTIRPLTYNTQLKLTTAKYYIPSGRCIQEIDYLDSRKKDSNELVKIPDSLTNEFRTTNGRIVRDGKGILPDIVIEPEKMQNIVYYLLKDYMILEYGAYYLRHHSQIAPVESFHLTDAEYEDFKRFLQEKDFTYDKQSLKMLEDLKKVAEFEGYAEEASEEFKILETKFKHNLNKDLDLFRGEIQEMLEAEIVKQRYYQKGAVIYSLKDDKDLDSALNVLQNQTLYKEILNIQ